MLNVTIPMRHFRGNDYAAVIADYLRAHVYTLPHLKMGSTISALLDSPPSGVSGPSVTVRELIDKGLYFLRGC